MRGGEKRGGRKGMYCHSDMIVGKKTFWGGQGRNEQRTKKEPGTTVIRLSSASLACFTGEGRLDTGVRTIIKYFEGMQ